MNDKVPITITLRISRNDRATLRRVEKVAKLPYSQICRQAIAEYCQKMLTQEAAQETPQ
jgi:hypothetical protein